MGKKAKPTQNHEQKKEQIEVVNVVEFEAVKKNEPEDMPCKCCSFL